MPLAAPVTAQKAAEPELLPETAPTRRAMPGWAIALILVLTCWLWIPILAVLFAVAIAVFAVLAALGVGLIAAGAALVICGIWALSVLPDALLMFGGAAICAAVGLVLLWLAIWLLIRAVGLICRGARGVYRGVFKGRKEPGL
jgi:hypothetical protein